ncbi:MAG: peptide chain release factor N(5)-glutamine methyltransferase [Bacteroidetes bacterium]|nr:peptide chain release factor N(5)-glutamine methyltransferase [Bacteroidota bacterium]
MSVNIKAGISIIEVLKKTTEELEKNGIQDSRLNSELLLCSVLNCDRIQLYLNYERPLNSGESTLFGKLISRRNEKEPLQYILGKTNFFGYDILLNRNVLIPRQETELLVERILEDIRQSGRIKVSLFEIGTGSGCISVALSKELSESGIEHEIFSIDNSADALETAARNLELNGIDAVRVTLYNKNVFEIPKLRKNYDYIFSNPPYIPVSDFNELPQEIKDYEPVSALTDNENGLSFYKKIFEIYSDKEFTGKVFCEIGFGQKEKLEEMIAEQKEIKPTFYKDHSDIYRILKLEK